MAIGDVYQVKLRASLAPITMLNVFHYQVTALPGPADSAVDLFARVEAALAPEIATVLQTGVSLESAEVLQIDDLSNYKDADFASAIPGERTGEAIANSICWSFRYQRAHPGQRSGWKRFSGISEADIVGHTPTAAALTLLEDLAGVLSGVLSGAQQMYTPCVLQRPIVYGTTPTVSFLVADVSFAGVGTQTSRKLPFTAG